MVREAGLQFLVRPKTGQKTGLFLDQREHRINMGKHSRDQTLLNLFAYNGGFSVHAAANGAKGSFPSMSQQPRSTMPKKTFASTALTQTNTISSRPMSFIGSQKRLWTSSFPTHRASPMGKTTTTQPKKAYRDLAQRTGTMVRPGRFSRHRQLYRSTQLGTVGTSSTGRAREVRTLVMALAWCRASRPPCIHGTPRRALPQVRRIAKVELALWLTSPSRNPVQNKSVPKYHTELPH